MMTEIKTENDEKKAEAFDPQKVLDLYATSPDACPACGFVGPMADQGCKLVCGGCRRFVFSSCSDAY